MRKPGLGVVLPCESYNNVDDEGRVDVMTDLYDETGSGRSQAGLRT